MVSTVGIVGYGNFGQFLHELGGKFFPDITMIIEDLYTEGLIEAGNYIINIDW